MFMIALFTIVKNQEQQILYVQEWSGKILDDKFLCMLSLKNIL